MTKRDQNRLIQRLYYQYSWMHATNGDQRTDLVYDGQGRLRKRLEYYIPAIQQGTNPPPDSLTLDLGVMGLPSQPNWTLESETWYVYDGKRVIQERNGSNTPQVSYTRGTDLSGSLEAAGGIGGLLARSEGSTQASYFGDGNGNITSLSGGNLAVVASYRYDPYGNLLFKSGAWADTNVYRFSNKEYHVKSGLYYYLYRWYAPELQRWITRDPIEENGGINLYSFVQNDPPNRYDKNGLITGGAIATLIRLAATAVMNNCAGGICSTRGDCETCCGAGLMIGNAALQGLLVGDLGESLLLIEIPPAAAGDAVISVVIYLWNTYNLASAYRDCMKSCKPLPSGSAPPGRSPAASPISKR